MMNDYPRIRSLLVCVSCLWIVSVEAFCIVPRQKASGFWNLGGVADQPDLDSRIDSLANFTIEYTGIKRDLSYAADGDPIPLAKEIALLEARVLVKRGEYGLLGDARVEQIQDKCEELGMTLSQGLLIRNQLMVTKVVRNTWKLEKQFDSINNRFSNKERTILQLSRELDLPPVAIVRSILTKRVFEAYPELRLSDKKKMVKTIISEQNEEQMDRFLSDWELKQLQIAKQNDKVSFTDVASEVRSSLWEDALYAFLDQLGVSYLTEEQLRAAGMRITPDCLLLDDCTLNGQRVRWIDAKAFYGCGLKQNYHFAKKLKKQIAKYEQEYGESGAVIFKHNYSKEMGRKFSSTLFLDGGPLLALEPEYVEE